MNFEEFLKPEKEGKLPVNQPEEKTVVDTEKQIELPADDPLMTEMVAKDEAVPEDDLEKLEVSNAVVEELAKDSVEQQETIRELRKQINSLQSEIAVLKLKIEEQNVALRNVGDTLAKNSESPVSTKITLLERDPELPDRFEGETRDHVLEALKESRDRAEKDGCCRHAQILESVLCANEPNGTLAKKRAELKKIFADNANIVSGPVIEELQKLGISHKNGEEYLLPAEIIKRTY